MKFLIHSNSPTSPTGYGVQVALLCDRLTLDGHDVAVSCNHGQDAGIGQWVTPHGKKVRLYPRRVSPTGGDIIHGHANHFFEGDQRAGWIIPLIDLWALRNPFLAEYNVAAWTPVDHLVTPPEVLEFFKLTRATPLAMAKFGERMLTVEGLDPVYIPLAVDTSIFKPTYTVPVLDPQTGQPSGKTATSRELLGLPDDKFIVGMVAMNKGNVFDRKGFSEAFYAFGRFHRRHPNSMLYLHTDVNGYEGLSLTKLAASAGIPPEALKFSDQYAYTVGFKPYMMAAAYTAMDVLLAPSHGEGFGVPLIEAQACGTPVIVSDATSQAELCGAGWKVNGQPQWDQSQLCPAFLPSINDIVEALEQAYAADLPALAVQAVEFAKDYDADVVYDMYWRPFVRSLSPPEPVADQAIMDDVAVIVPVMQRPQNVAPLVESFNATNDGTAKLYFVCDPDDDAEIAAVRAAGLEPLISHRGHTFGQKANVGYEETPESWLFLCGDDVEFTPGWLAEARKLSDRYHVIGSNDSERGRIRNPQVATGRHADHWFTRRAYIDDDGSSLEGPGVFCPEAYGHWYTDKEVIGLARARGVFGFADECRVIHHHPGYDGDEQARQDDPVYMKAVDWQERDRIKFMQRVPLIEQQRVARGV